MNISQDGEKISARSPAKINLFLHIIEKRADKYHNLQTCFVLINWFDTLSLRVSPTGKDEILASGAYAPQLPPANASRHLLRRVLESVRQKVSIPPLSLELEKNIPVAAGLGGSSSNAAHFLLLLNQFFDLALPQKELLRLAAALGSDVPLFILGEHALAEGRGEILIPLREREQVIGDLRYLLICPQMICSTQQQFSLITAEHYTQRLALSPINLSPGFWLDPPFHNPFLNVLLNSSPDFYKFHRLVCQATPNKVSERVFLSGSGGCLFAAYADADKLKQDASRLQHQAAIESSMPFTTRICSPL